MSATPRFTKEAGERGPSRRGGCDITAPPTHPPLLVPLPPPPPHPRHRASCAWNPGRHNQSPSTQVAPAETLTAVITGKDAGHLPQMALRRTGTLLAAQSGTQGSETRRSRGPWIPSRAWPLLALCRDCGMGKSFVFVQEAVTTSVEHLKINDILDTRTYFIYMWYKWIYLTWCFFHLKLYCEKDGGEKEGERKDIIVSSLLIAGSQ